MMTRRQALTRTTLATVICASAPTGILTSSAAPVAAAGPFSVPPLRYPFDALEPHIDARTMEIHHDKHHAAYVANLNKAVAGQPGLEGKSVEEIVRRLENVPEGIRTTVRNNGGGHLNHSLFWPMMSKKGGGTPKGELAQAIDKRFGSFAAFQDQFTGAATKVFGSGWAWLTWDGQDLKVESTPNQDNPLSQGRVPLLGLDVWEHAYYLKYQSRRPEYIAAFYNVINWDFVTERYRKARG